jgi:hypothetical protein
MKCEHCEECKHELEICEDCGYVFCKKCGKRWYPENSGLQINYGDTTGLTNDIPPVGYKVYC